MERQKEFPSVTTRFGDPGTLFHDWRAYADLRGEHSFGAWHGTMRLFESEHQARQLCTLGCQIMQGYYFYRPMPIAQFEALLQKQAHRCSA